MSESIVELAKALNEFQKDVKQPKKDADNPFFKSKYVPLPNVIEVIQEFGAPHGLSYMQMPVTVEGKTGVQTMVMHTSGEYILHEPLLLPMDKQTAQGAGSAITYSRRYSLSAAFGLDSESDDDGNSASGNDGNNNQNKQQSNSNQNNNYNRSNNQSNNTGGGKKASEAQRKFVDDLIPKMMEKFKVDEATTISTLEAKFGQFGSVDNLTVAQAKNIISFMQDRLGIKKKGSNNNQQHSNQSSNQQQTPKDMEPIDISDDDLPF